LYNCSLTFYLQDKLISLSNNTLHNFNRNPSAPPHSSAPLSSENYFTVPPTSLWSCYLKFSWWWLFRSGIPGSDDV